MRQVLNALANEIQLRRGVLTTISLELTHRCNLRCVTCGAPLRGAGRSSEELSAEDLSDILADARDLGARSVVLVGSEPTMRRDLVTIVQDAKRLGYDVCLITNGTKLTPSISSQLVSAGLDRVVISIDGPQETNDMIRGTGSFDLAISGLRNLIASKKDQCRLQPQIDLHCTVCKLNVDSLCELATVAHDLGMKKLNFQLLSEVNEDEVSCSRIDGDTVCDVAFAPRNPSLLPALEQAAALRRAACVLSREWMSLPLLTLSSMKPDAITAGRFPIRRCAFVRQQMVIGPYGDVVPCSLLGGYSLGNVRRESLSDIWFGKRREHLLKTLQRSLLPICSKCCHHVHNLTPFQKGVSLVSVKLRRLGQPENLTPS